MANEHLFNHDPKNPVVKPRAIFTQLDMLERLNEAALACNRMFDLIEDKGIDIVLEDVEALVVLANLLQPVEDVRGYYARRSVQRMLALGVSPETLMNFGRKE